MRTVIALLQRQELGPVGLAPDLPVLPREPQRGLDRVGSTRGEEGAHYAFRLEPFGELVGELDRRAGRGAAETRIVGQRVELISDRLLDGIAAIAEIDVPEAADRIQHGIAVDVGDVDALSLHHDPRRLRPHLGRMGHRVPDRLGVVLDQKVSVAHGGFRPAQSNCSSKWRSASRYDAAGFFTSNSTVRMRHASAPAMLRRWSSTNTQSSALSDSASSAL